MVVHMSSINQFIFCCILHNFVFGGRSAAPYMHCGNTFPLMLGKLLMQATWLPHKMMEGGTGCGLCIVLPKAHHHTLW